MNIALFGGQGYNYRVMLAKQEGSRIHKIVLAVGVSFVIFAILRGCELLFNHRDLVTCGTDIGIFVLAIILAYQGMSGVIRTDSGDIE